MIATILQNNGVKLGRDDARITFETSLTEGKQILNWLERYFEDSFLVKLTLGDTKVEFVGNFPDIKSIIKIGRDSVRFVIDAPLSERQSILELIAYFIGNEFELELTPLPFQT